MSLYVVEVRLDGEWTRCGLVENWPRSRESCEEDVRWLEQLAGEREYRITQVSHGV